MMVVINMSITISASKCVAPPASTQYGYSASNRPLPTRTMRQKEKVAGVTRASETCTETRSPLPGRAWLDAGLHCTGAAGCSRRRRGAPRTQGEIGLLCCFRFDLGHRASNAKKAARRARKVGMMRESMGGGSATESVQPERGHDYDVIHSLVGLFLSKIDAQHKRDMRT